MPRYNVFQLERSSARRVFFSRVVLFLDKRLVLLESTEQLRRKIRDTIKQIYPDREIRTENKRAVGISNKPFDLIPLRIPSGCALDQRNTGHHRAIDVPTDGTGDRKIDRDIRSAQTLRQLRW